MGGNKRADLPDVDWQANDLALTWELVGQLEKHENYRVLFGKRDKNEVWWTVSLRINLTSHQNTSSDTKVDVYKRIAERILPELYARHSGTAAERVKGKINR